ncbi:MAG TPA: hypothetical protein V6C72_13930, partial [Chroococcales cyanobacterium]
EGDQPVVYTFFNLSADQVITLVFNAIERFSHWHHLRITQGERGFANQLAVTMELTYLPPDADKQLVVVAQAEPLGDGCKLWLNYYVPDEFCQQSATRGFCRLIEESLEQVQQNDWLMRSKASDQTDRSSIL